MELRKILKTPDSILSSESNSHISHPNPTDSSSPIDKNIAIQWLTGADAVQNSPEQKELFWNVIDLFTQCNKISDEKIALVERAKLIIDRHIRRLNHELEIHNIPHLVSSSSIPIPDPISNPFDIYSNPHSTVTKATTNLQHSIPKPAFLENAEIIPISPKSPNVIKHSRAPSLDQFPLASTTPILPIPSGPLSAGSSSSSMLLTIASPKKKLKRKIFASSSDDDDQIKQEDVDEEVYCMCRGVSYGEMIACDNGECDKEWFHLECVGLKQSPDGVWLCPECVKKKAES